MPVVETNEQKIASSEDPLEHKKSNKAVADDMKSNQPTEMASNQADLVISSEQKEPVLCDKEIAKAASPENPSEKENVVQEPKADIKSEDPEGKCVEGEKNKVVEKKDNVQDILDEAIVGKTDANSLQGKFDKWEQNMDDGLQESAPKKETV